MNRLVLNLFAVRWLGADRTIESFLAATTILYGVIFQISPHNEFSCVIALYFDIREYESFIHMPLLAHGFISFTGIITNIRGYHISKWIRFAGALLGCFLFTWYAIGTFSVDDYHRPGFAFTVVAALFSFRLVWLIPLNLPAPGVVWYYPP